MQPQLSLPLKTLRIHQEEGNSQVIVCLIRTVECQQGSRWSFPSQDWDPSPPQPLERLISMVSMVNAMCCSCLHLVRLPAWLDSLVTPIVLCLEDVHILSILPHVSAEACRCNAGLHVTRRQHMPSFMSHTRVEVRLVYKLRPKLVSCTIAEVFELRLPRLWLE